MAYKELTVGQVGMAHWTNSHLDLRCKAEVVKINQKTIKVKLLDTLEVLDGRNPLIWPIGWIITLPAPGHETTLNKFEYDPTEV
jgi:hypothetical protein